MMSLVVTRPSLVSGRNDELTLYPPSLKDDDGDAVAHRTTFGDVVMFYPSVPHEVLPVAAPQGGVRATVQFKVYGQRPVPVVTSLSDQVGAVLDAMAADDTAFGILLAGSYSRLSQARSTLDGALVTAAATTLQQGRGWQVLEVPVVVDVSTSKYEDGRPRVRTAVRVVDDDHIRHARAPDTVPRPSWSRGLQLGFYDVQRTLDQDVPWRYHYRPGGFTGNECEPRTTECIAFRWALVCLAPVAPIAEVA
jgi:hypothetical protein